MLSKLSKIFLVFSCGIFVSPVVYSRANQSPESKVLANMNGYLKAVHLDKLVRAVAFSAPKEVKHSGSTGLITLGSRQVLLLEPDSALLNPIKFAAAWQKYTEEWKGKADIPMLLFLKLADYSDLPAESVACQISTAAPEIFSLLVYFDNGLRLSGPVATVKGDPGFRLILDPGDLDNGLIGCTFQRVAYQPALRTRLIARLTSFLKTDVKGVFRKDVQVKQRNWGTGIINFTASNIRGRVTPGYNEVIVVHLVIVPSSDQKSADIALSFEVLFSGSPPPPGLDQYESAIKQYKSRVSVYGGSLRSLVKSAVYGK